MSSKEITQKEKKNKSDNTRDGFRLVGIGSSAGGLEALRGFIESLPDSFNLCYVVAQHVSPTHESLLMNLLASSTELSVKNLGDNQVPEPSTIYITPPNRDVIVKNGRLCLTEPHFNIGPKPSINHLFNSMAEEFKSRAIGIVLSGTGSDGAAGLRAIKAAGGVTLAQDPCSAKYDGMPRAAIRTGSVDLIQSPENMGATLDRLVNQQDDLKVIVSESDQQTDDFAQVLTLVRQQTSFQLKDYKPSTIRRRIARRMGILGMPTLNDYAACLTKNDGEAQLLVRDTFIGVTSFFRDENAFFALEKTIDDIVARKPQGKMIRCWVPGCASGEEAYSIALLFEQTITRHARRDLQYIIFASDLDPDALEHARQALYPLSQMADIPKNLRTQYTEELNGYGRFLKHIRNRLVFTQQNVIEDPPFSRLDLISCRNLLIYFNQAVQKQVLEIFHYALNPDGFLFLGKSESAETDNSLFKTKDKQAHIFSCLNKVSHYSLPISMGVSNLPRGEKSKVYKKTENKDLLGIRTLEMLAEEYAPPSLVINDADNIIHFQGNLKPFLNFPKGTAQMYLFNMLPKEIRAEMRALIYRCRRKPENIRSRKWQISAGGEQKTVRTIVSPLEAGDGNTLMVSFRTIAREEKKQQATPPEGPVKDNLIISELEQELSNTRTHLHVVVEELETANEELQSLNEELQSTNEELQSTNEELQTSNEELQSTNEELLTVNDELQVKTDELEKTASDIVNVKESLAFPLIVVNTKLIITQANKACGAVVAIDAPLENASLLGVQWLVEVPGLGQKVRRVMDKGVKLQEILLKEDRKNFCLHIMPYYTGKKEMAGALLLFEDIEALSQAQEKGRIINERFDMVTYGGNEGFWDWDLASGEIYWSPRFNEILGYGAGQLDTTLKAFGQCIHPDDRKSAMAAMHTCRDDGVAYNMEFRVQKKSGEYIWVAAIGHTIEDAGGDPSRMSGSITEITPYKLTDQALKESELKFHAAMDHAPMGTALEDMDGKLLEVNQTLCRLTGYDKSELSEKTFESILFADDLDSYQTHISRLLDGKENAFQMEIRLIHKSGRPIWVESNVSLVRDSANGNAPLCFICQIQDIAQRKLAEEELRLAASVFGNTQDGIMIMTRDKTILKVNHAFEQILGYRSEEIVGKNRKVLRSGRHEPVFYEEIWNTIDTTGSWQGEVWERHKNGRVIPVWFSINSLCDGKGDIERYIAILYDLTDQKKAQERINYLAHYDVLTGLPNRAMFKDRLSHAVKLAERQETMLALLFIDLDNFKQVNDTYGHHAGDELLCQVAEKLQATVRKSDTLSRLGGDEFIIALEDIKNPVAVKTTAEKIVQMLSEPVILGEASVFLSASIGIALFPDDGRDIETLVKHADMAMYRAKDEGRNQFRFYREEMSKSVIERSDLQNDLRQYMEKHGLELYYQPVVDSHTRQCIGVEALVRWRHDEKGFVPPEKFIPIAEENDLIHTLGEWVLYTACRQMKAWIDEGIDLEFISVNVSGKQISQGDFIQKAERILELTGCPAEQVTLELTENFVMEENQAAVKKLKALRKMGFGLAIDDFGTGYASLSHLKDLPLTTLKVDRTFVRDINTGSSAGAIAGAIIKLGDRLGLKVIAEGVENEDQHQFLQSQHGTLCQGFLYAKPMSSIAFSGFSKDRKKQ